MNSALEALLSKLKEMPDKSRLTFEKRILERTSALTWFPNEGPQTEAYFSLADILLYGGQAGGGKSQLLLGCACQRHFRSIIFRRESSQTDGLESEGKRIIGESASYNGVDKEWEWEDGKSLKLAGMKEPDDWMKHAGRERDFIGYDEAGEFLEKQVRSMVAWLRGPEGQRARMVLASNPPRTAEGLWMLKWFAPWLDRNFPNAAAPGELRWGIFVGDELIWKDSAGTTTINGEEYIHLSFTFIPASLEDNPFRNTAQYRSKLQSLPEPLRSQLLYGDFTAGIKDAEYQLMPTDWIIAAQNRWTPEIPEGRTMSAMAFDPADGGEDSAELARRYGGWYAPLISAQGEETADGSKSAATIVLYRRDDCPVVVDVTGGYGGKVTQRLGDNGITDKVVPLNGSKSSGLKTADGTLDFANKRAEIHWRFREALDPDQEGGSAIALPPDPELRADLAAARWTLSARGILIEEKKVIKLRLGRSPGKGEACMMALSEANKIIARTFNSNNRPKIIQGYAERKRQR
jgi:hypothetical protein